MLTTDDLLLQKIKAIRRKVAIGEYPVDELIEGGSPPPIVELFDRRFSCTSLPVRKFYRIGLPGRIEITLVHRGNLTSRPLNQKPPRWSFFKSKPTILPGGRLEWYQVGVYSNGELLKNFDFKKGFSELSTEADAVVGLYNFCALVVKQKEEARILAAQKEEDMKYKITDEKIRKALLKI